jgi:hypothetical protein
VPWYVYGLTGPAAGREPRVRVRGIEDGPVQVLGEGDLRVVVTPVSEDVHHLAEADPHDALATVQRHDEVLVELVRDRSVMPVRFGTVLPDDEALADVLADPDGRLRAALAHVADAQEWVVSVTVPDEEVEDAEGTEGLSPGHAFFARRRQSAEARTRARTDAVTAARELDEQLQALARDMRPLDLPDAETIARGAYLVPRGSRDPFLARLSAFTAAEAELQGPLPPYRFASASG